MAFDINLASLGLNFGGGAVIGGIIGFAAKKIAKVIAVIIGVELALFKFLEARGFLNVNWDKIGASFLTAAKDAQGNPMAIPWVATILSTLSISAGFAGGFLVGFKRG